jgi:poly-beta-1,6-N-acetyl-D-glucosamine N-deacetylase PgaB
MAILGEENMKKTRLPRIWRISTLCGILAVIYALIPAVQGAEFHVLCYHDVRDDVRGYLDKDQYAVATETLVTHLDWLVAEGYTFVTLDQVLAAQAGKESLPEKSVLLTFDDGYNSIYSRVFPLLQLYEAPAVVAIVTEWLDGAPGTPREKFITWEQAREMRDSGLVEFASHSGNLHHSSPCNPQGGTAPAIVTRRFLTESGNYESIVAWQERLTQDLEASAVSMRSQLGRRPRTLVWPYGEYNDLAITAARAAGMKIDFTLGEPERRLTAEPTLRRHLITANCPLTDLSDMLKKPEQRTAIRLLEVRIADWYSDDPSERSQRLDHLMDLATFLGPNRVLLDVWDRDANGRVIGAFYASDLLEVRADIASRMALLMSSKCGAEVIIPLPPMAGEPSLLAAEICQRLPIVNLALRESFTTHQAARMLEEGRRWRPELKLYDTPSGQLRVRPMSQAQPKDIAMVSLESGAAAAATTLQNWLETGARDCGIGPLRPDFSMGEARVVRAIFSSNENPYRESVKHALSKFGKEPPIHHQ